MERRHHINPYQAILEMISSLLIIPEAQKYWVGIRSRVSLTSWGEGTFLALIGPSNDGVTKFYWKDASLHAPLIFLLGWLTFKLNIQVS